MGLGGEGPRGYEAGWISGLGNGAAEPGVAAKCAVLTLRHETRSSIPLIHCVVSPRWPRSNWGSSGLGEGGIVAEERNTAVLV